MTTALSDQGVQFADGNIVDISPSVPATGTYTQGDVVIEKTTRGEVSGWKRLTTGAGHVLGTDWLYFGQLGVGQTWQNVTGSRVLGTTYYNTTGKPITVAVSNSGSGSQMSIVVNGAAILTSGSNGLNYAATFIVPPGGSYVVNQATPTVAIANWSELR